MSTTSNDLSRSSDIDIKNHTKSCSYDQSREFNSQMDLPSHNLRKNGDSICTRGETLNFYKSASSTETYLRKLLTVFLINYTYRFPNKTLFTLFQSGGKKLKMFTEIFIYPCHGYLPISAPRIPCSCWVRMDHMENRLRSFQGVYFPDGISIEDLANDGFYFCENNYIIQCYCCGMVPTDCRNRHSVHSQDCQHVPNLQLRGMYLLDGQNPNPQTTENQIVTGRESNNRTSEATACASTETQVSYGNLSTGCSQEDNRQTVAVTNDRSQQRQTSMFSRNGRILINNADTNSEESEEVRDYCIVNRRLRLETTSSRSVWQLRQENMRLRSQHICILCQERPVRVIFLPCGHLISCESCSMAFSDCPVHRCQCRIQERLLSPASSS